MSVDQTNTIDFLSINQRGDVVLTISDHLEWDNEGSHGYILQEKLNRYLAFIESGEILSQYPDAKDRHIVISIVALNKPNAVGVTFLQQAKQVIEHAGIGFRFEQRYFNSP